MAGFNHGTVANTQQPGWLLMFISPPPPKFQIPTKVITSAEGLHHVYLWSCSLLCDVFTSKKKIYIYIYINELLDLERGHVTLHNSSQSICFVICIVAKTLKKVITN
jgi:hypothetical protein